jgi:hypothetical protein
MVVGLGWWKFSLVHNNVLNNVIVHDNCYEEELSYNDFESWLKDKNITFVGFFISGKIRHIGRKIDGYKHIIIANIPITNAIFIIIHLFWMHAF